MSEFYVKQMLRAQAWERAKGELFAMLATYYSDPEKYERADDAVKQFIAEVEGNALAE